MTIYDYLWILQYRRFKSCHPDQQFGPLTSNGRGRVLSIFSSQRR
jgi:hypothetical protein